MSIRWVSWRIAMVGREVADSFSSRVSGLLAGSRVCHIPVGCRYWCSDDESPRRP